MFRFRTNHQPPRERRDGFVSFRCFLWLGGGGWERTDTGIGEDGIGLGEDGRGRTRESGRMGEDFERKKEELEDGHGTLRREKQGFRKDENQDFEKVKTNSGFLVKCKFG